MDILQSLGSICVCKKDDWVSGENAYILSFPFSGGVTTIRVVFADVSGAELAITNMTTIPISEAGKGHGAEALRELLTWARAHGYKDIRAVQVQEQSWAFWVRNGFRPTRNQTNDFCFM